MSRPASRLVARLDIKAPNLVKGISLEGLRVLGEPGSFARKYYEQGIDELLYVDIVASLYQRNGLLEMVERTASEIFVPLTVGGGIRSSEDIRRFLRAGADKVAINTAAVARPELLEEASRVFGAQCIVLSVEAKRLPARGWEAFTDNGRERTGRDVLEWVVEAQRLGIGEILLTSVDSEGSRKGMDLDLVEAVASRAEVPVVACGGAGSAAHVIEAFRRGASAVAVASLLHYGLDTVASLKTAMDKAGIEVRA